MSSVRSKKPEGPTDVRQRRRAFSGSGRSSLPPPPTLVYSVPSPESRVPSPESRVPSPVTVRHPQSPAGITWCLYRVHPRPQPGAGAAPGGRNRPKVTISDSLPFGKEFALQSGVMDARGVRTACLTSRGLSGVAIAALVLITSAGLVGQQDPRLGSRPASKLVNVSATVTDAYGRFVRTSPATTSWSTRTAWRSPSRTSATNACR